MNKIRPVAGTLDDEDQPRKALDRLLTTYGSTWDPYATRGGVLAAIPLSHLRSLTSDLHMPGLIGIEVLQTFDAKCSRPPRRCCLPSESPVLSCLPHHPSSP